jgi:hypothetical protein
MSGATTGATTGVIETPAELAVGLRDAMSDAAAADRVLDALYGVEGIEDAQLRGIVEQMRDQTKILFERVRARVGDAKVEIEAEAREGAQLITRVRIGDMRLELCVDDVHERDGGLRTRDLVQIRQV